MSHIIISCPNCGETDSARIKSDESGMLLCTRCNVRSFVKTAESEYRYLKKLLNELSLQEYHNSLQNLFLATNIRYPNKETVLSYAAAVKKHNPNHIFANLYELLLNNNFELTDFINKVALDGTLTEDQRIYTAEICIKNLNTHIITAVNHFIDTNFREEVKETLYTQLEEEATKLDEGIYDPNLSRDVFVAHSSKDKKLVEELVKSLETAGFKCFISTRNLRHGVNAGNEYKSSLEKAMDNCNVFLLINTKNVRKLDCDVMRVEIPYIKKNEKEKRKPRINYLVEPYGKTNYDEELKNFFSGFENCSSIEKIKKVLTKWLTGGAVFQDNTDYKNPTSIKIRINKLDSLMERECNKFVPSRKILLELENDYYEAKGHFDILMSNQDKNTKDS